MGGPPFRQDVTTRCEGHRASQCYLYNNLGVFDGPRECYSSISSRTMSASGRCIAGGGLLRITLPVGGVRFKGTYVY